MDRTADVFIVRRPAEQHDSILHVLHLRQAAVRQHSPASSEGQSEEAVILDREACLRVERILYQEYLEEPETQALQPQVWQRAMDSAAKRREETGRASAKEFYNRSMRSYWRNVVFDRYGGEIWLLTLIATGRVHPISVRIVNRIFAERIHEKAGRAPVSDPAALAPSDAPASSRGQEVKGVQHKKNVTGQLREAARLADKKWKWCNAEWSWRASRGRLRREDEDWWRKTSAEYKQQADRLWAEATEESMKAGHQFKDRDGTMVNPGPGPPPKGTFTQSLDILVQRIKEGVVTWPPP